MSEKGSNEKVTPTNLPCQRSKFCMPELTIQPSCEHFLNLFLFFNTAALRSSQHRTNTLPLLGPPLRCSGLLALSEQLYQEEQCPGSVRQLMLLLLVEIKV